MLQMACQVVAVAQDPIRALQMVEETFLHTSILSRMYASRFASNTHSTVFDNAGTGTMQLGSRTVCRDETPLRPPANLAAIQQQRQMRLTGVQIPRPTSRGQEQPLNQYARNKAFVLPPPPAKAAAKQRTGPKDQGRVAQTRDAAPGTSSAASKNS